MASRPFGGHGRLTFTSELARAIRHLMETRPPHGIYNVTGSGPVTSWTDVARQVFSLAGHDPARVTGVNTDDYFATATGPVAHGRATVFLTWGRSNPLA